MIGAVGHPWRTFVERFAAVLAAVVVLLAAGTLGFVLLGDWPVADAAWRWTSATFSEHGGT